MGIPVPRKGKPVDVMYEKVTNLMEGHNLVVALDGVDSARLDKEALYTTGELTGKGLSLVLVANGSSWIEDPDKKIRRRLAPMSIEFEPYSEAQIARILRSRANESLRDN